MGRDQGSERPPFVVVEGLDGAGTTTQCRRLVDRLRDRGWSVRETREPSDGPVGSLVRQMLSERVVVPEPGEGSRPVRGDVLALLFAADRLDHVDAEIAPALEGGHVVVSDRYYHSSFAYQSGEDEDGALDTDWVRTLNARALQPDLTVFLRAPAEVCLDRLSDREKRDRYESAGELETLEERYEQVFAELAEEGHRILEVDATRPVDMIHEKIYQSVGDLLDERSSDPP